MTEGKDDLSAAPAPSPGSTSPTGSAVDTGQVPKEKPEETEAAVASEEEGAEGTAEAGGGGGDGEHLGALGIVALPGSCCVCIEMDRINNCLHSEKICILPILACLLSLALCTAGLKWVFVDKIFEYDPPTHLDPKRIGQDPVILSGDPTLAPTASTPHPATSTASSTSSGAATPGLPDVLVEDKSTRGPQSDVSFTLRRNAEKPATLRPTPRPQTTPESNYILTPTISASRTTSTTKTSSHVTRCRDSQRNYCVNGGECFTLEIMPGSTKFLCRCPNEFTGDRCQNYVMATFYKAEELYQKRILTITGICIALLVVGIMCVVGYCKTKKRRKELHDRLRQSLRKKRNNNTHTGVGPNTASSARGCQSSNLPLQDLQLINQRNGTILPHSAEKETETTFSSTPYDLSVHEPTAFTNVSNQRLVSAASRTSLETPGSPPSEMSAPLSSLAISVPSVALSPSGEEERPLLLSNTQKSSSRGDQKRTSAHYNHGHVAHSLPPSPLLAAGGGNFQTTGERDATSASASPETLAQGAGLANGNFSHDAEPSSDAVLRRETEGALGERPPLATAESMTALLLRAMYSRTHPAPTGSPILDPVTV